MSETKQSSNKSAQGWDEVKRLKETSREAINEAFAANGGRARGYKSAVCCPFHDDRFESADIRLRGGKWYFKCHKENICLDVWDLEARALGKTTAQHLGEQAREFSKNPDSVKVWNHRKTFVGEKSRQAFATFDEALTSRVEFALKRCPTVEVEGIYAYDCDLNDEFSRFCIVRLKDPVSGKKYFPQFHQSLLDGKWYVESPTADLLKSTNGRLPLLNRRKALESETILIVEGEQKVEYFERLGIKGITAVSAPLGAKTGSVKNTFWQDLAGKKVIVWGDKDEADSETGIKQGDLFVKDCLEELSKLVPECSLSRVRTEELEIETGDLVDFLKLFEGLPEERLREEVMCVLGSAEKFNASGSLKEHYLAIGRGEFDHIHFHAAPQLSRLTQAVTPGSTVLVAGNPGAGKSYHILEQVWRWYLEKQVPLAIYELEKNKDFWLKRAHSQMAGKSQLTSVDWVEENVSEALALYDEYAEDLDRFSRVITPMPTDKPLKLLEIADWIEAEARQGKRIVIVDPVTMGLKSANGWLDDFDFMVRCNQISAAHGCTIILITHPKNESVVSGKPSLGSLAGGTAYYRFADVVLWFKKHKQEQTEVIDLTGDGRDEFKQAMQYRHEIQIWKSRNGAGDGVHLAILWDSNTSRFAEIGEILGE